MAGSVQRTRKASAARMPRQLRSEGSASGGSEGGRPRDATIDAAVIGAALALLDEVGYSRLTVEAIARRAGTTKPAVYRRWSTLPELLLDALTTRLGELEVPDTACTICDLSDAIKLHIDAFHRLPPDVLASLLADCGEDAARRRKFMTTLFEPPRRAVEQAIDTAMDRGDLRADIDRELLIDLLGSLVHYRVLFDHASTSDDEVERAVHVLLRGVAVDYDRLVAVSREKAGDPEFHHRHAGPGRVPHTP